VSTLIITYNQRDYIGEAIDSALDQDYPNTEIVIADDGSTDGTAEIVTAYAHRFPEKVVPVLNNKNLGVTANSNAGLAACTGELVAFMGGDDVFLPGKIGRQVAWFAAGADRVLCGHQVEVFYEDGSKPPHRLSRRLLAGLGADKLLRHQPFGATAVMVRRDRIPAHGFDSSLPVISDHLLWVEVVRGDGQFGYIEGSWARYRRHSNNVSANSLAHSSEVERSLALAAERYPFLRDAVDFAITRRLHYDMGVTLLRAGRKQEARRNFRSAIEREPLFLKAWVRLVQSIGLDSSNCSG
jgi:glycosyltransferase involved in cell wall biosynthesis